MIYIVIAIILIVIIGPSIWVKITLNKYSTELSELPGTGGEFAIHLINRFGLTEVSVEQGEEGQDHYSPDEKCIRLSPRYYNGKSITAVAIAAHEFGHALQYFHQEPITKLREKYTPIAMGIERLSLTLIAIFPVIIAVFKVPQFGLISVLLGLSTLIISVLLQFIILPMEWDASFNKAYPILEKGNYLHESDLPKIKRILRAAALTYVAATLSSLLNIWRWVRLFRR